MAIQRRQSAFIHLFIIIIGLIAGYIFGASFRSAVTDTGDVDLLIIPNQQAQAATTMGIEQFNDINFNFSFLDDTRFTSLRLIGDAQVNPGPTGRTDIFAPF